MRRGFFQDTFGAMSAPSQILANILSFLIFYLAPASVFLLAGANAVLFLYSGTLLVAWTWLILPALLPVALLAALMARLSGVRPPSGGNL